MILPIVRSVAKEDCAPAVEDATPRRGDNPLGRTAPSFEWGEDRRARARYPVALDLKFIGKYRGKTLYCGVGRTVDMSSAGVAFQTNTRIRPGVSLDLAITWPALLDGVCRLQLNVSGRLVRGGDGMAVCEVCKYEFRSLGRPTAPAPAPALVARAAWTRAAGAASAKS